MMGIELMENFKSPYFSTSVKMFWQRWHISLSTWFKDYVYIPLGGNRVSAAKHKFNLIITFLVSGLWHGANWTFVVWGAIHGLAQVIEGKPKKCSNTFEKVSRTFVIFSFVCIAWIFFRASSFSDVIYILSQMFSGFLTPVQYLLTGISDIALNGFMKRYLIIVILILTVYDYFNLKYDIIEKIVSIKATLIRWFIYVLFTFILIVGILLGYSETPNAFVYFQF